MVQNKKLSPLLEAKYLFRYGLTPFSSRHEKNLLGRKSYAQAGQDLFALFVSGFKYCGSYVEIGSHDPIRDSNSFLLEQNYNWSGLSFEINEDYSYFFNRRRRNVCVNADATLVDYGSTFSNAGLPKKIDYLQIDIDPAHQSLCALKALPLNEYRFGAITFEHDRYQRGDSVMRESRKVLLSYGYELLMPNIHNLGLDVEDWWIDPTQGGNALSKLENTHSLDYKEAIRLLMEFDVRGNRT